MIRISVYSRGKGRWQLDIEAPPDPATGRRRRIYKLVRGTKAEAEAEAARIAAELERGTFVEPTRMSTADYLRQWLEASARRLAPSTLAVARYIVERHLISGLGEIPLQQLRPMHIERLAAELDSAGYAPSYREKVLKLLRQALRQAVRWQVLATNPAEAIRLPGSRGRTIRALTREEARELLDAARERPLLYRVVFFALHTGMRRGEIAALMWDDVDWDRRMVRVQRALQYIPGQGLVFTEPKTASSRRAIALGRTVMEMLAEHRRDQEECRRRLGPGYRDHGLVFAQEDGRPWSPDAMDRAFQRLCRQVGLEGVRFHDLRHTHATWLLEAGVHPKVVQERLGHSSITMTMDLYSHVLPTLQHEAARRLDDLFAPASDSGTALMPGRFSDKSPTTVDIMPDTPAGYRKTKSRKAL